MMHEFIQSIWVNVCAPSGIARNVELVGHYSLVPWEPLDLRAILSPDPMQP